MRRSLVAILVICAGILGVLPAGAGAAGAKPAWTIEAVPYPSAFEVGAASDAEEQGPAYLVQAYNVGAGEASGTFTVTDTLPKGVLPMSAFPATGVYGPQSPGSVPVLALSCSAIGRKVTCTGGSEGSVGSGEAVSVVLPVEVEAKAKVGEMLVDTATIEGGGAPKAETTTPTPVGPSTSPFGFIGGPGLYGLSTGADGLPASLAGSHPFQMTVAGMNLTTERNTRGVNSLLASGGGLRDADVELPAGTAIDPQATAQCKESELETPVEHGEYGCPKDSQVGLVALTLSVGGGFGEGAAVLPLYNMVPPPGHPAELGFEVIVGSYVHLLGNVRSDGSFTLTAMSKDVLAKVAVGGVRTTLWGNPSAEVHDHQRGGCLISSGQAACPVERTRRAFVTMSGACSGPLVTAVQVTSWLGEEDKSSYVGPESIEDCESLGFEPSIKARPTNQQADSPTGLEFDLHQPQNERYENEAGELQRATAALEKTTVSLPEGMTLDPSAGNGLEACTSAQIGLTTAPGVTPIRYGEESARCPAAAKLGTVSVNTPLLGHELEGSIYLAKPFENPFGSLLAIYLAIEDEAAGIFAKLAGKVEADPTTGRLRTTFEESPQLPLEDVNLHFFDGPRAALTTPLACGQKTIEGQLTSWSSPDSVSATDSFGITSAPGGGTCPSSEAQAPAAVSLSAGTTDPLAGAYSPFVLKLGRDDGTQRIVTVDTTLPAGLTGKLAGIPYCSDSQIAQAEARSHPEEGKLEQQSPSCPKASEVGMVTVGAGSGSDPVHVTGHAYLAGSYKGAPLSMVIITPAVTGPFDLGVVVVRVALEVNPETARITAKSDSLPTILDGIPLDVRSIVLELGRREFTLNPTNCDPQAISAQVASPVGGAASTSERFGLEGCERLAFKPKVAISLKGPTKRTGHPALTATVTYPKTGEFANIARAQVSLPHSEFLDNNNIGKSCTRPALAAHVCPTTSIYGKARAWTPLLEKPLEGPVYLVGGYGYKLPALVAELAGQIRVILVGKVDTGPTKGIRSTFEAVPDAPVEKFVLSMKGGKHYGLLVNSEDVCRKTQKAQVSFTAQNGRTLRLASKIANGCKAGGKKHKKGKKSGAGKH